MNQSIYLLVYPFLFDLGTSDGDSGANPKGIVVDNPTSCLLLLGAVFPFQGSVLFFKSLKPDSFNSVDKEAKGFQLFYFTDTSLLAK